MRIAEARRVCRKWQAKLKLSSLDVTVRFPVPSDKFDPRETVATCWWHPEYSRATVVVRRNVTAHDIVHELLHIRLEGHTSLETASAKRKRSDVLYERALNAIAEALTGVPE